MSDARRNSLLVCYVPGMDLRRIDARGSPFVHGLLQDCPWTPLRTLPTTEHVPTMLTGAYPHEHGKWGPRLPDALQPRTVGQRVVDLLPDVVTTTAQGFGHILNGPLDLALVPARRRRRFGGWARYKYVKHWEVSKVVEPISDLETIFTVVGRDQGTYVYHGDYSRLDRLLDSSAEGTHLLEMVEVHCLDKLQHWRLDRPAEIADYYRGVDTFLGELFAKCRRNGLQFVLLSDHGMEPVIGWIDLASRLRELALRPEKCDYFVENAKTTFWVHDDAVRERVLEMLATCSHTTVMSRQDLRGYGLCFADRSFGDFWLYADSGYTFFPNDFHQVLAAPVIALLDWQERPRIRDPRHKGDHGYLPENPSESGFLLLADAAFCVDVDEARLVDFAPTVLDLLDHRIPPTMRGDVVFRPGKLQ